MPAPGLIEAVFFFGEKPSALCTLACRARIEGEMEFSIERIKELLRRWPFFRPAAVQRRADGHERVLVGEDTAITHNFFGSNGWLCFAIRMRTLWRATMSGFQ